MDRPDLLSAPVKRRSEDRPTFCNPAAACAGPPGSAILICYAIDDLQQAAQRIAGFLNTLNKLGGLRLKYRISASDGASEGEGAAPRQISVELAGPMCLW